MSSGREEKAVYARIMTYEKRDGRWLRVANVSTFDPGGAQHTCAIEPMFSYSPCQLIPFVLGI